MRRLSPVNIGAMVLALLFVCICGGGFLARNTAGPWQVITTRNEADSPASVSVPAEETAPVSLLPGEQIDLNTAAARDLARLPQIGEKRAADIVAFREEQGPFQRTEDLMQVSGIGEGIFGQIKAYVTVSGVE